MHKTMPVKVENGFGTKARSNIAQYNQARTAFQVALPYSPMWTLPVMAFP
jgi:hypothetical protein